MTKKKIVTLALSAILAVTAIAGASLAYLTDTDEATNTFTVGKVEIKLIEQEREYGNDGSVIGLKDFTQGKKLYPIVGSAQGVKDRYGLATAENYVDKIVTVKNLDENAYVRVYVAVPAALVNDGSASEDILHWNWGNKFSPNGDYAKAGEKDGQQNATDYEAYMGALVQLDGTTTIDDVEYIVYYQTYNKVLTKDEVTGSAFMVGMYLDKDVNYDGTNWTKNGTTIDFDLTNVKVPVFAVGVQSKGFDNADTAITSAFGANYNPWA